MNSEPAEVYFGSVIPGNTAEWAAFAAKVDEVIKMLDFSTIKKKDKVAIKMHLGFRDGYQTVPVFFVRRIVKAVKEVGGYPFITDNPTAVYNAAERGYTQETCGCPLIPIAGVKDSYTYTFKADFHNVKTLEMGGVLHDADALIDLTHVKGHNTCGFGGAIKNIALGGYHGPSRWTKIHGVEQSLPYWNADKCTPEHAKKLVDACEDGYIKYDDKKHKLTLDLGMCHQCLDCLKIDKNVGCLQIKQENFSLFQELMAIGANEVLKQYDEDKKFFLNFAINITPFCDCWGFGLPNVLNDIGVLGSRDIVAVERASLDLIGKQKIIENMMPPFVRLHKGEDLHPFQKMHGPMKNPYITLDYAEKLGMGSQNYKLIEVLAPKETNKQKGPSTVTETAPSFY
ncbi:MAG: DUF362 domain-containing protein [Candidatus Thorarchaeota archaeon SMTZ1-45]|nr:MAG: hypothetical protein AM325_08985 [Candidatus Thorarchaeota archaeon SMTZ1-45]